MRRTALFINKTLSTRLANIISFLNDKDQVVVFIIIGFISFLEIKCDKTHSPGLCATAYEMQRMISVKVLILQDYLKKIIITIIRNKIIHNKWKNSKN